MQRWSLVEVHYAQDRTQHSSCKRGQIKPHLSSGLHIKSQFPRSSADEWDRASPYLGKVLIIEGKQG